MTFQELESLCSSKNGVVAEFPFGENTLVFKVMGKMFLLVDVPDAVSINVKIEPERNAELQSEYPCVKPGYHMNKQHWATIPMEECLPDELLRQIINTSYELVVSKLKKSQQFELLQMTSK